MRRSLLSISSATALAICAQSRAVILYSTGNPTANTAAATGTLTNSGWQYVGQFGGFTGMPIGPHAFITANHIAPGSGTAFTFQGNSNYHVTSTAQLGSRDMVIAQVDGTFPYWAPIYNPTNDGPLIGNTAMIIGRGTQRGSEINVDPSESRAGEGTLRGWNWGSIDGVQRWGTNTISGYAEDNSHSSSGYFTFDFNASASPNQATISDHDSGGGVFTKGSDGIWKLAGVVSAIEADYRFTPAAASGRGAIFDFRDLYIQPADQAPYELAQNYYGTDAVPLPASAYISNVTDVAASDLSAYIPRGGDANINGTIDGNDFTILAAHFGMSSGAVWYDGDFNYDGIVNALDFNILASHFGQTYTAPGAALGSLVPEPAMTCLLSPLVLFLPRQRRWFLPVG